MSNDPFFNIVLLEPQIPNNTGNIGRLCVGTHSRLHLVEPLGFEITDKRVKRAGLDYWPNLNWQTHSSFETWYETVVNKERVFFFTTKTERSFYQQELQRGDWLVFGKEESGFDATVHETFQNQLVTIPFPGKIRSFNLANAVAMTLGEGMRQLL